MSVESVSLNLLTGLNSIYQSICSHLTPENRESILGSALWKLSGRGTGKTVVALALYSDALRMVLSAIEADGKISEDEMSECEQFFVAVASTFAKVRSEYSEFANLSKMEIRVFLQRYKNDKGVFGYQDESTKWAGVSICQNVQQHCSDGIPLSNFRKLLLSAARALIAADGVSDSEQLFLKKLSAQLKNQLGSDSAAEELIVDFLMSPGSGGGADSGSSMPQAMTNEQWDASLFKEKKASSSGERQQRTTVQHSQITPMALYSPLSKQSQYNDDSKKRLSQPEKPQPKVVGPVSCPKCGSTQIFGSKRGFNHQNAAIGTLGDGLAAGLLMGSINSDDVVNNCISCGNSWTPRPERPERAANPNADSEFVAGIWAVVGFVIGFGALGRYLSPNSLIDLTPGHLFLCAFAGITAGGTSGLIARSSVIIQTVTVFLTVLLFGSIFVAVFWFVLYYLRFTGQYGNMDWSHVRGAWSIGSAVVGFFLWIVVVLRMLTKS